MKRITGGLFAASIAVLVSFVPVSPAAADAIDDAPSLLDLDTTARYDCPGGGTCWGVLIAQDLQAGSEVSVTWTAGDGPLGALDLLTDLGGDLAETELNLACGTAISGVRALGTTNDGRSIQTEPVDAPC